MEKYTIKSYVCDTLHVDKYTLNSYLCDTRSYRINSTHFSIICHSFLFIDILYIHDAKASSSLSSLGSYAFAALSSDVSGVHYARYLTRWFKLLALTR
jgi:hypothetical protein